MSSAVAGYKATLGADAPPCSYEDIDHADCLLIAGSNTAWAHPVLFRRIEDARSARPQMKLIVVDPRRTDTAEAADLHLAILPGTDIALYNAMLHVLMWEDLVDADYISAHTDGFDALKTVVRDYTPAVRPTGPTRQGASSPRSGCDHPTWPGTRPGLLRESSRSHECLVATAPGRRKH
jgi:assimilatory nitrate reductase catalytic subunit